MKKNLIKSLPPLLAFGLLCLPFLLLAAPTISNPLKSDNVIGLLNDLMKLIMKVGAMVVVFFIILSGYKLVTAGSNEGDRTKAKEMFYATVIGGAILLGADIIANVVVNTVSETVGKR
jgi:hypothetical protein